LRTEIGLAVKREHIDINKKLILESVNDTRAQCCKSPHWSIFGFETQRNAAKKAKKAKDEMIEIFLGKKSLFQSCFKALYFWLEV